MTSVPTSSLRTAPSGLSEPVLERVAELLRGLEAIRRLLRERAHGDRIELRVDLREDARRCRHRIVHQLTEGADRVVAVEQGPPSEQLPEDDPHREEVRAPVDRLARRLLGRHVRDLPLQDPDLGLVPRDDRLCDPEIDELHLAVVADEDVVGANVAMDDLEWRPVVVAQSVGVSEAVASVGDDPRRDRGIDALPRLRFSALKRSSGWPSRYSIAMKNEPFPSPTSYDWTTFG